MSNLWLHIIHVFQPRPEIATPQDTTVYSIETHAAKYCGRIIYQDDVIIRLKCTKHKPVKILKANIARIVTVKNETVDLYQAWLSSKTVRYQS